MIAVFCSAFLLISSVEITTFQIRCTTWCRSDNDSVKIYLRQSDALIALAPLLTCFRFLGWSVVRD